MSAGIAQPMALVSFVPRYALSLVRNGLPLDADCELEIAAIESKPRRLEMSSPDGHSRILHLTLMRYQNKIDVRFRFSKLCFVLQPMVLYSHHIRDFGFQRALDHLIMEINRRFTNLPTKLLKRS